jgi:hypothetical protein
MINFISCIPAMLPIRIKYSNKVNNPWVGFKQKPVKGELFFLRKFITPPLPLKNLTAETQ